MQSILQLALSRLTTDKVLHDLELVFPTSFKSTGVVENITAMAWKNQFVLDVMAATLHKQELYNQPSETRISPNLH